MSKTSPDKLVEETRSELHTYLKNGNINEAQLGKSLDFNGLDISDFERLKTIHFVLSQPVIDFVRKLPERVRRIKTESDRENVSTRGEIKGRIDWNQTLKTRYSQNFQDSSLFVTQNPYVEYNIPENLVLKKVLSLIFQTLTEDLKEVDYSWRTSKWSDKDIEKLENIFRRNVHIDRIKGAENIRLTSRELNAARRARSEIYNEAYKLYRDYEKLQNNRFEEKDVEDLLNQTLVVPKEISTLYELYCIFNIVSKLEEEYKDIQLQIIEPGSEEIALMENEEKIIKIFHDSQGTLKFREEAPDLKPEEIGNKYLEKYLEVLKNHETALEDLLDRESYKTLYSGRPDLVIEIYEKEKGVETLEEVVIGEIKYTDKQTVFSQGLKELFEYMKYGRKKNYLEESVKLQGLLITDNIETNTTTWNKNGAHIQVLNTVKLQNRIEIFQ